MNSHPVNPRMGCLDCGFSQPLHPSLIHVAFAGAIIGMASSFNQLTGDRNGKRNLQIRPRRGDCIRRY